MKTAMQELFDKVHSENMTLTDAWEWLMNNEKQLLEKEKQQIIKAHNHGYDNCENGLVRWIAEDYYKKTFEQ